MDIEVADADLVARAQRGDVAAYATLIERNQTLAVGLASLVLGDASDAEDVAQEAFIKAYYALDRFRVGASFRAWLVRIVVNEARNFRSAAQRRTGLHARLAEHRLVRGQAPSAEEVASANEQRDALLIALERIREDDRQVLAYRYLFDLSEAEMAEALGCSRGTVKSRLSRALGRLREDLKRLTPVLLATSEIGGLLEQHLPGAVLPGAASDTFAAMIVQRISTAGPAAGAGGGGGGGGVRFSPQQIVASAVAGVVVLALAGTGLLLSASGGRGPASAPTQAQTQAGPGAAAQPAAPTQSSSSITPGAPAAQAVTQTQAQAQPDARPAPAVVVYGGELTDAQRQEVAPLFNTAGQVDTQTVSHAELVATLQAAGLPIDGTERAISSAELTCLRAGDGLRVRTENISELPAAAYANALVSAGIADASVIVAAPPSTTMTGETALVGVLKAYPSCHAGQQPQPARLRLAYDQLQATAAMAAGSGTWDRAAAVMLRAAQAAITSPSSDTPALSAALDGAAAAEGLVLNAGQHADVVSVMSQLAAVDHGTYSHGYAIQQVAANEVQVLPLGPGTR